MSENDEVVLLFPPFADGVRRPSLALACLTAYLRSVGVGCVGFDLNRRYIDWRRQPNGALWHKFRRAGQSFRELRAANEPAWSKVVARALELARTPPQFWEAIDEAVHGPIRDEDALPETVGKALAAMDSKQCPDLRAFIDSEMVGELFPLERKPLVVGISISFACQLFGAFLVAERVRKELPDAVILFGGPQVTLMEESDQEMLIAQPFVDGLCRYEGELVLEKAVEAKRRGAALDVVPNLVITDAAGGVHRTPVVPAICMNDAPTPVYDAQELAGFRNQTLPVYVTRGCYWGKCRFCDYHVLVSGKERYQQRSAALVVDDVETLIAKHGLDTFDLITDALPPNFAKGFCKEIIARGIVAKFRCYLKNEKSAVWTPELIALMGRAGFERVTCGVEATSNRLLALMDKGNKIEDVHDNLRHLALAGIEVRFNLIVDYPTATLEEAQQALAYIEANRDLIRTFAPMEFDLSYYSHMAQAPHEYGLEIDHGTETASNHAGAHSLAFKRTTGMTAAEAKIAIAACEDFAAELDLYHATKANRRMIDAQGFDWAQSSFNVRWCVAVPFKDRLLVVEPVYGRVLDMTDMRPVAKLLLEARRVDLLGYHQLVAAFRASPVSRDAATDEEVAGACAQLLTELVWGGFVQSIVNCGGPFRRNESMTSFYAMSSVRESAEALRARSAGLGAGLVMLGKRAPADGSGFRAHVARSDPDDDRSTPMSRQMQSLGRERRAEGDGTS